MLIYILYQLICKILTTAV